MYIIKLQYLTKIAYDKVKKKVFKVNDRLNVIFVDRFIVKRMFTNIVKRVPFFNMLDNK